MSGRTRRQFLQRVGQAGGASFMLAAMGSLGMATPSNATSVAFQEPRASDFSLTGRAAGRVLVLGGGVTGLACAYELGKAGYDCTVLEAQQRTGGRNLTIRNGTTHTDLDGHTQTAAYQGNQYLNAGPARIAQWMVTLDYCRELGVPVEVFTNVNAEAYIYRERHGMTPGHPVRRREAQSDVNGYVAELLAKATDQGALNQQLTAEDREKVLDLCRHFGHIGKRVVGDPAGSWAYKGGSQRGYTVAGRHRHPGHRVRARADAVPGTGLRGGARPRVRAQLQAGTRHAAAHRRHGRDPERAGEGDRRAPDPARLRRPGDQRPPRPGQRDLPGRPSAAAADRRGLRDRHPDAELLAKIPHNLGSGVQQALRTFTQEPAGKIGLEYRSRWWETNDRIYGGVSETDLDLTHIWPGTRPRATTS